MLSLLDSVYLVLKTLLITSLVVLGLTAGVITGVTYVLGSGAIWHHLKMCSDLKLTPTECFKEGIVN